MSHTNSPTLATAGRFVKRPIKHVGLVELNGWRLKRYEITVGGHTVDAEVSLALNEHLEGSLPHPSAGELGVGFLIVHHGTEAVWALACLWSGDIMSQHTFTAKLNEPGHFTRVPAGGPTACVYELPVHANERDAFVRHILDPPFGPNTEAYLADVIG